MGDDYLAISTGLNTIFIDSKIDSLLSFLNMFLTKITTWAGNQNIGFECILLGQLSSVLLLVVE